MFVMYLGSPLALSLFVLIALNVRSARGQELLVVDAILGGQLRALQLPHLSRKLALDLGHVREVTHVCTQHASINESTHVRTHRCRDFFTVASQRMPGKSPLRRVLRGEMRFFDAVLDYCSPIKWEKSWKSIVAMRSELLRDKCQWSARRVTDTVQRRLVQRNLLKTAVLDGVDAVTALNAALNGVCRAMGFVEWPFKTFLDNTVADWLDVLVSDATIFLDIPTNQTDLIEALMMARDEPRLRLRDLQSVHRWCWLHIRNAGTLKTCLKIDITLLEQIGDEGLSASSSSVLGRLLGMEARALDVVLRECVHPTCHDLMARLRGDHGRSCDAAAELATSIREWSQRRCRDWMGE